VKPHQLAFAVVVGGFLWVILILAGWQVLYGRAFVQ